MFNADIHTYVHLQKVVSYSKNGWPLVTARISAQISALAIKRSQNPSRRLPHTKYFIAVDANAADNAISHVMHVFGHS